MTKRLTLGKEKKIFGVCSGVAEYFDIDPIIIRILFVFATLSGALPGILPYIILALIMNKE